MEIGYEINECVKLFTWKGSGTNNIINVSFNEMRNYLLLSFVNFILIFICKLLFEFIRT